MTRTVVESPRHGSADSPGPGRRDLLFLLAWFIVDVLFAFDRDFLRELRTYSPGAVAALVSGALGFCVLLMRHRYPLAVFCFVLAHSLSLATLTNLKYVSVFGVWLALRAVAELHDGVARYGALFASLAPSVLMAAYLHSVTVWPATNVVVIVIASYAVLIVGFWEDGIRRRRAQR